MSYARADDQHGDEELIREFYNSLKEAVSKRVQDQSPPVAYFDQANLQPGDDWPDELANALCSCNTFLPIMTARYFTREYCGREWTIFDERRRGPGSAPPPLIIPILWVPPVEGPLPEYATDLQVMFDPMTVQEATEQRNIKDYGQYGLEHVAKRKKTTHINAYDMIVVQLAVRIIEVTKKHPLQPLARAALPSLKTASNRFATIPQAQPALAAAASGRANFAIVAASEVEWMPYAPKEPEPIGLIAQAVATEKRLIANWMPVGPGLVQLLEQAETANSVAVMIVDPWVVQHHYRDILQQFDKHQFRNCVVLIPWNKSDPTMQAARDVLLDQLRNVLSRNFEGRKETYFRPKIEDHASLRAEISCALSDLESLLAPYRQPARKTGESDHNQPPQLQT